MTDPTSQFLPASVRAAVQREAARSGLDRAFADDLLALTFRRLRSAGLVFAGLQLLAWSFSAVGGFESFIALAPHRTAAIAFSLLFAAAPYIPPLEPRAHTLSVALTLGTGLTTTLFTIARHVVRLTAEVPKPNGERLREYRDSNLDSLKLELFSDYV